MSLFCCNNKCTCTPTAIIASVVVGVVTAFLQIIGVITATPVFLVVVFGIAVVYLGILVVATLLSRGLMTTRCICSALNTLLVGILGSILFAGILLAVGIVATSVLSAILVGILLFFFALTLTGSACLIRHLADCGN